MLTDDLFATYMEFCHLGSDQVAMHVRNTYQFHVDTLNLSLNNLDDQPDGDGDGGGAQNQCSNVVLDPVETIQPPQDDRAARRVRRDAQRQTATTVGTRDGNGGNNGNGDDDDDDDDGGGGDGDDDGNGNGNGNGDGNDDAADNDGNRNRNNGNRNADGDGDGDGDGNDDPDPDPPGDNNEEEDGDDELNGFYMRRDPVLPHGIDPTEFDYNLECRKLSRAFHSCNIPDSYH